MEPGFGRGLLLIADRACSLQRSLFGVATDGQGPYKTIALALWMVRQRSPELAQRVASFLLIDKRSSQTTYMIQDHLSQADPLIARFDCWVRDNLARGFSIQEAADALSVGPRTLHRRLEAVLGKTPLSFVQDLRVEHALHLTSLGYGLEDIATEVGYANSATLRTLLRRKLGRGVRELKDEMRSERAP